MQEKEGVKGGKGMGMGMGMEMEMEMEMGNAKDMKECRKEGWKEGGK